MIIYGYENYNIIVCYTLYNEITGLNEYRENPVTETRLDNESYVLKKDYVTFKSSICVSDASQVLKNAKLCFDATSKFPRYKLEQTEYKRKLKPETADYVIINTDIELVTKHTKIYTNKIDTLYVCMDGTVPANKDVVLLDSVVGMLTNQIKNYLDLHKTKYKYLSDDQLNQLCDAYASDLTLENLNQIINLVFSRDKDNIELGLKVFAATNVSKYPMTARFLLSCANLKNINKNVTIKNLISQSDIKMNLRKSIWGSRVSYWEINRFFDSSNIPTTNNQDKEFALRILHKFIKEFNLSVTEASRFPWFKLEYYNAI